MDPAQGETGGKSLTSKFKAKVPHPRVKDKVKNLKNRLPGMKKHSGGDDEGHEDSSEYDDGSPRSPGPETGYNGGESTQFSTVKATPVAHDSTSPPPYERTSPREVQSRDYDSRPSGYDAQNRNYVAAAPPTRPAPTATDSPRSTLAPSMEEKFQYLDVGKKSSRVVIPPTSRSYQPEQQLSSTNPQTDPIRSYLPEQQYSPSTTESMQKGYSDVPRNSYRANPNTPTNKGMVDKVKESVTGAAVVLGDKMGYYNDAPRDPNAPSILDKAKSTLGLGKPRDPTAPSVQDKAKSTLGMDKPSDPNASPLMEKAKAYMSVASQKTREYGASAADRAAWTKDRVAAQTTPTHHDKALAEQVTQTLSTLPGAIREKVFGPAATNSPKAPGVVDRVSGAVSSLFTAAPKETAERLQHTFPAHSDYHPGSVHQNSTDRSSTDEGLPAATSTPAYPMVNG